jgi:hypothetical protein
MGRQRDAIYLFIAVRITATMDATGRHTPHYTFIHTIIVNPTLVHHPEQSLIQVGFLLP